MALGSSGRRIVVEFIGDASSLKSGVNDGEAALSGFSGKAQAAGAVAGKVLAGGLILAGVAAVKATQAAADDEAAQAQLAQQLRQAAGASDTQIASTEEWITAQGKATGMSDDELRPALARLATATGDVQKAQDLAALAMDVSAGSGKSYQSVTEALAKAQNGNIGALGRLGIATKDADGKTKSLAQITDDLSNKYKGAAASAADTAAGKQKILTTQMGELQEQIGAKLLPVMVKLANVGLQVVDWISKNTTTVGILVGAFAGLLAITTAVGAATKAFSAIQTIIRASTIAWTAVQWLLNAALTANPIGLVVVAIAALVAGFILAYKHSETFRNIVNAAFGAIKDTVVAAINFVVDFVRNHWQLLIAIIGGPLVAIGILVVKHWDAIKGAISAALGAIKSIIGGAWDAIVGAVRNVVGTYRNIVTAAFNAIRDYFRDVVAGWKTIFNNAWDAIKAGFQSAKDAVSKIAGNLRDAVTGAIDGIKGAIDAVGSKFDWLIGKIQSVIDKIKSIPHPDIPFVRTADGASSGNLSAALHGGSGVLGAVAGAAGLGRASATADAGGATQIVIHVATPDPATAGDYIVKALRQVERRTGRQMLVDRA